MTACCRFPLDLGAKLPTVAGRIKHSFAMLA
jgi:hypothetical protein